MQRRLNLRWQIQGEGARVGRRGPGAGGIPTGEGQRGRARDETVLHRTAQSGPSAAVTEGCGETSERLVVVVPS